MALGLKPTLTEIKTELGSSNNKLSEFISEAGKTGVWDRQSDFASYAHGTFEITETNLYFDNTGAPAQTINITSSGDWTLESSDGTWLKINGGLTGTGNDTRTVYCSPNNTSMLRAGSVTGALDDNSSITDSVSIYQEE